MPDQPWKCSRCKKIKVKSDDPKRSDFYARESTCKTCRRHQVQAYDAAHPEKAQERRDRWRKRNPDRDKAVRKATYERVKNDPVRLEQRRAWQREYQRRKRREQAELVAQQQREYRARVKQDPERYERMLANARMSYRLRKGADVVEMSRRKNVPGAWKPLTHTHAAKTATWIEAAPFFVWLDSADVSNREELCTLAGFSVRRLSDARRQGRIRLDIVEAFLDVADGPLIHEVYEELAA